MEPATVTDDVLNYPEGEPFPGVVGRTLDESTQAWPASPVPDGGSPNVVVVVLDDVGYGQLSTFGGLCETPTIDRLADRGLRYANFQTTALCSPTRACLLTGRNHHTVGMASITELSLGFPAHNSRVGPEHGFLSEILLEVGYNTFAVGKWHLTPPEETSPAGPFARWPLGRGFERYYGFLGGDTDQWHPDLIHDNHWVPVPATPEEGYHLNADLADHAIGYIGDAHASAPDKPFFLYYATGAGHAPHQVEPEWIERYRGAFDGGWDEYRRVVFERQLDLGLFPRDTELSGPDPDVHPWDSLSDESRRLFARQMEVYAGFISQTDHHLGRVIDFIDGLGRLDNTIVIVMSDNGASAEGGIDGTRNEAIFFNLAPERLEDNLEVYDDWGGVDTFPHYSWGWTWAGDTPFRRWKRETYRGGITDPCVVSWPAGMRARGEVRTQYAHATDIWPTVLEAIGIDPPTSLGGVDQSPVAGVSLVDSFDDGEAASRHQTQYFEMFAHRSIYHDGWKAVCPFPGPSFNEGAEQGRVFGLARMNAAVLDEMDATAWELYRVADDPTECHDRAGDDPDRLAEMIALWWSEAERHGALPVASLDVQRLMSSRLGTGTGRDRFVYRPGGSPIPFAVTPRPYNRPHTITASVQIPDGGAEGVLLTHGNRHGGYALFVAEGHLCYVHNYLGLRRWELTSTEPVPSGEVSLAFAFEPTGDPILFRGTGTPGTAHLSIDGRAVGELDLPYTVPLFYGVTGLSCGYAAFDSVSPARYTRPFTFTGTIDEVVLDIDGDAITDAEAEMRRIFAQQ